MTDLETLSATLFAAVPGGVGGAAVSDEELADVEWPQVSSALRALHARTNEELGLLASRVVSLDASVQSELATASVSATSEEVAGVEGELAALLPQLQQTEQHFQQVEALVRPKLSTLQNLQARAAYLQAAVQVETRSQLAKQRAAEATPDALKAFQEFTAFVATLPVAYDAIRVGVGFREADRRVTELSVDLRHFAVKKLQHALDQIAWPEPLSTQQELAAKEPELRDVAAAFAYLLTLQLASSQQQATTADLWAMDCVLEPLLLRFRFHFERAESATNRLAKPEWYLSHVQEQTRAHTRFLAHVLTPELHRRREEVHCWDAQILLLRGLVKAASRKLSLDLPTLLAHPPLLCHTLDEVLLFEQSIDNDVGYGSWANADRRAYPRCVDVFTSSTDVLFAWTSADVEYAHRVLTSTLETGLSDGGTFDLDVSREKQEAVWQLDEESRRSHEGPEQEREQELVPPVALEFVALLDFLSQRFTLMETEEHRYLYVMQVHLPLLRRFGQLCDARGRQLINRLGNKSNHSQGKNAWRELFVVVNALQHVAHALAAWEQSSVFLELSRKLARSETTRTQVLRMHVAYSKQVLSRAAHAASAAVLTSDEAAAVRHALAGPGAMIGPTAALSAAYSVGSKTMMSLFRRAETGDDAVMEENTVQSPDKDPASTAALAHSSTDDQTGKTEQEEEEEAEALLFSHTIFERQIAELKALATALLEGAKNTLVRATDRDFEAYRTSHVLACARSVLLPECWPAFWKSLASALDVLLFDAFYHPSLTVETTDTRLSDAGERQFAADVQILMSIFAAGSTKTLPRSYLCLSREVCRLLEMPGPKLREICKALDDEAVGAGENVAAADVGELSEQLTTILEACGVYSLTPGQVVRIGTTRLHLARREPRAIQL
ncbi:hypothetical protein BBJ28_00018086 [Nothophytophthora sp. Chile5]|nr:hypothetical protein BBJ28_00018086 [Nothophytophthora sp. Chile5]